jgi:hypothetical protein
MMMSEGLCASSRAGARCGDAPKVLPRINQGAATLDARSSLDQNQICEPFVDWRLIRSAPHTVTLAFDDNFPDTFAL